MKVLKKLLYLSLILGMVTFCSACGSDGPDEKLVRETLEKQISNYNPNYYFSEYEVLQSFTEDRSFSGSYKFKVTAEYAEIYFISDIGMTKYDQGWQVDYSNLIMDEYYMTGYPEDEIMLDDMWEQSWKNRYPKYENGYDEITDYEYSPQLDGDRLLFTGKYYTGEFPQMMREYDINAYWQYAPEWDTWLFDSADSTYKIIHTCNFEGIWDVSEYSYYSYGTEINVTNQTETGFDVRIYGKDVHFEREDKKPNTDDWVISYEAEKFTCSIWIGPEGNLGISVNEKNSYRGFVAYHSEYDNRN